MIEALKTRKETGDIEVLSKILKILKILSETHKVKGKPHKLYTLYTGTSGGMMARRNCQIRDFGILYPYIILYNNKCIIIDIEVKI